MYSVRGKKTILLIINFQFGNALKCTELRKDSTDGAHMPLTPYLLLFSILHSQGTVTEAKEPTSVHDFQLISGLYLDSASFPIDVLFVFQSRRPH